MPTADENRAALIDALIRLTASRTLSDLSVREIAREAGVNHGLVHRHFGSKDNLIRAATERIADEIHAVDGGRGHAAHTFRYLADRPELVRVLAQACLEGRDEVLQAASPSPDHLCEVVDRIRGALDGLGLAQTPDPHVLNGYAIASILGWILFRPLLQAGYGVGDEADDEIEGLLELLDLTVRADGG